jgi:hypothetical protein
MKYSNFGCLNTKRSATAVVIHERCSNDVGAYPFGLFRAKSLRSTRMSNLSLVRRGCISWLMKRLVRRRDLAATGAR